MIHDDMQDRSLFWDVMEGFVTLAFILGLVASLCALFGYIWYRP
jgi:hypothetical protein